MRKLLVFLLCSTFSYSQSEYKYDANSSNLPNWAQEMYSKDADPGKVEVLYGDYYKKNPFIKNKHTQYYKRWRRSISRDIGVAKRQKFTVEGNAFEGSDKEWNDYITSHLPTKEDEEALKEIFEQEWIENKPMSTRQIESGIGATA